MLLNATIFWQTVPRR